MQCASWRFLRCYRDGAEYFLASATMAGGTLAATRTMSCNASPASGSTSVPVFCTSACKAGEAITAANPARSAATVAAGTFGGATIERPISLPLA
jgi:hypothetical protein